MAKVIQAKCPRCSHPLRIPVEWIGRSMRCKKCEATFRPQANGAHAEPAPIAQAVPVAEGAVAASPVVRPAVAVAQPFADLDDRRTIAPNRYRRRSSGVGKILLLIGAFVFGGCLLITAAGFGGAMLLGGLKGQGNVGPTGPDDLPEAKGPFPRRMLAISVCNYLYANPVSYGSHDRTVHDVVHQLGTSLKVPDDQVFELTDGVSIAKVGKGRTNALPEPRPVVKSVIEDAIRDFADTARGQDRIVLLFVGHAVEIDGAVYLVPIDGELGNKATLIPLTWVYEQLVRCKARQKVLILDVCRFDPGRGAERPGSEAMSDALDAALKEPPAGVQVWSACVAKQNSYELDNLAVRGGGFLQTIYQVLSRGQADVGIQKASEPLPLPALSEAVRSRTQKLAKDHANGEQTPRLTGRESDAGAAFNPNEPPAARVALKTPPEPEGGRASPTLVKSILDESEGLIPSIKMSDEGKDRLRADALPPFSQKLLDQYKSENASTPLREATLKAIDALKKAAPQFRDYFSVPGNDAEFKKEITAIQKNAQTSPGLAQLQLEEALKELEDAGKERDKEPSKRWQANYDYVLAKLKLRIAYVYEYNYMLGLMKRELPDRDPEIHQGWRLASQDRLQSGREAREFVKDGQKVLEQMGEDHKGTPWEVLAKRERMTAIGLKWEPYGSR